MKRLFALWLALLCIGQASAETIAQQVGAPEKIVFDCESASGRTHVYVDAEVVIPAVGTMGTYEVVPRTITPAETETLANLYFGPQQWWHGDSEKAEVFYTEESHDSYTLRGCELYALGNTANYLSVACQSTRWHGQEYYLTNRISITNDEGGFSQNAGTAEDARKLADQLVLSVWSDMVFDSIAPALAGMNDRYQGQYGYRVYYRREVNGVPVTPVSMQIWQSRLEEAGFTPPLPYERLFVDVDAEGIFRLVYDYPAEIKAPLAQDVGLLPFEQIMSVFERIAPLSIASAERGENNMLSIDRITLGYMGTPMKDEPSRYQLIPVWDFFGTRSVSGEVYSQYLEPLVTINAMDGTVIDRKYGY